MRIVIDMQGAQTESRYRGIGRYTIAFAQGVVRNRGEHEIILVLSGLFPETIEPIRAAFDGLLPQENIRVWHASVPVKEELPGNDGRRETAELLREAFLASLQPDVIHVSSLFEGYVDDAVTSIGRFDTGTPVSVILYDLIPLLNPDHYLRPNPNYERYYLRKVDHLQRASLYLAISDFSREEGIGTLGVENDMVISISTAIDGHFQPLTIDGDTTKQLTQKFGIRRAFVLYTGGSDERKNLPRLIEAFAALPKPLRDHHQLLLAGKMPEVHVAEFRRIASANGLQSDELRFTGYVSEEELVQLYNLCGLYVFPSWHEGFGLPALEAMACGAPVIGANTASLPGVIGLDEALFDPFDTKAMAVKMAQALQDDVFRKRLREHGFVQAKRFSWDASAQRAIAAWAAMPVTAKPDYIERSLTETHLYQSLAKHWSPMADAGELPALSAYLARNQQAGIERQLFLDVSELCQRDSATGVQRVVRSYLKWLLQSPPAGYRVEPVYATREEGYRYARGFTQRFLGLPTAQVSDDSIRWQRGDLFFGLDMQHHVQLARAPFYRQLQREGVVVKFLVYDLLPVQLSDLFKHSDAKELHEQWLRMIASTDGAVCISKATADALEEWITEQSVWRAPTFRTGWVHIGADIDGSQPSRGLPDDAATVLESLRQRPSFLCVSTLEPRKRQEQILEAVEQLWQTGTDINLVLVGQPGWQTEALAERLCAHPETGRRLFWLRGISDEYLEMVYAASSCLISASLNEGFGLSLIEAARHGVPVVARDIPVFREVAGEHAFYFQGEGAGDLVDALGTWLGQYRARQHPPSIGMQWLTWQQSTERLKTALIGQHCPRRQLLVDISELVQRDARSGIQRVVRSILREWLLNPPEGYRVEPVYATLEQSYRYARKFTQHFIGSNDGVATDEPIDYAPGDVFFALDFQPRVQVAQQGFYQTLRRQGIVVRFMVYDLLCVLMPQHFPKDVDVAFAQWLDVVAENDGAVCISAAVAQELTTWIRMNSPERDRPFDINWCHLGADVDNSHPTKGLPPDAESILQHIHARPGFLMVGTLEPRKGHTQVLDAFEQLRRGGIDIDLVIVGKRGWMVDEVCSRLRSHSEVGRRLFWLEGVSDEYLEKLYAASSCIIAASYGEGFGLPLIEAVQHKLPIIARDIPVFREVAGTHAYYFEATTAEGLANSIKSWLELYCEGKHPGSDGLPWLTWKMSSERLKKLIL